MKIFLVIFPFLFFVNAFSLEPEDQGEQVPLLQVVSDYQSTRSYCFKKSLCEAKIQEFIASLSGRGQASSVSLADALRACDCFDGCVDSLLENIKEIPSASFSRGRCKNIKGFFRRYSLLGYIGLIKLEIFYGKKFIIKDSQDVESNNTEAFAPSYLEYVIGLVGGSNKYLCNIIEQEKDPILIDKLYNAAYKAIC